MLSTGEIYRDLGGEYFTRRDPDRRTKRLIQQLQQRRHSVTLTAAPAPQTNLPVGPIQASRYFDPSVTFAITVLARRTSWG